MKAIEHLPDPKVHILRNGNGPTHTAYLNATAMNMINMSDIAFHYSKMMIQRPSMQNTHTLRISKHGAGGGFSITAPELDSFAGVYDVIRIDEDRFYLKPQEESLDDFFERKNILL